MEKRILIDLNDKKNWLYESSSPPTAGGYIVEDNRVILMPEGEHRLFAFTDAVMHYAPDMRPFTHDHHTGFETFFVDSGSMDFYSQGKVATLKKGDLVHIQPYVTHGMLFHEDTRYRGIFQDWTVIDNFAELYQLREYMPDANQKMAEQGVVFGQPDFFIHEVVDVERVAPEEINAVRNPNRPLAQFKLNGVTLNMVVGRWETNGVREIWQARMDKGFHAEWNDFQKNPELYYVTEGEVKFTVYGKEFIAHEDCLVKIPKLAPHSVVALSDSAMYDLGGLTMWYLFLTDYTALIKNKSEKLGDAAFMKELKAKYGCEIKSFGI
ncbi:MAG: cupin domain-containing protein [Clostridiales bacterium]|jgi:quercetin dioxygenase-like cupin family protein|nr:cupin domain-containing protein [Clostridiales bacterium]